MKCHTENLTERVRRAGVDVVECRYRVVAVGLDYRGRLIGIRTNRPHLPLRGRHAEERLIHSCPASLAKILIARLSARGEFLPIEPCAHCRKLAERRAISIITDHFV